MPTPKPPRKKKENLKRKNLWTKAQDLGSSVTAHESSSSGPCLLDEVSQVGCRRELTVLPRCPRTVCELCPGAASPLTQPWPLPLAPSSVNSARRSPLRAAGRLPGVHDEHLRKWTGLANHTPFSSQHLFASLHWLFLACRVRATLTSQARMGRIFRFCAHLSPSVPTSPTSIHRPRTTSSQPLPSPVTEDF